MTKTLLILLIIVLTEKALQDGIRLALMVVSLVKETLDNIRYQPHPFSKK